MRVCRVGRVGGVRRVVHGRVLLAAALFVMACAQTRALASCPRMEPGPACLAFWHSDAVFVGTVTQVVHTPNTTGLAIGPHLKSSVYFTVDEAFRGVEVSALTMEMDYCGYPFKQGERYLVYAYRNPHSNELKVRDGNTRTRPLSEAGEDLEYIRGLATAAPGTRLFGNVMLYTHDIRASKYEGAPLKGVTVFLEGSKKRTAVTDEDGGFEFEGLPAGAYKVRAELPAHFSTDEAPTLKLTGRGCAPLNLSARRRGGIVGRVLDADGRPVVYAPVSLVSADAGVGEILAAEFNAWTYSLTNEQGRFEFSGLPPGRYLLVINRTDARKMPNGDDIKLPRLFYPGVSDITQATALTVTDAPSDREYVFRLPR